MPSLSSCWSAGLNSLCNYAEVVGSFVVSGFYIHAVLRIVGQGAYAKYYHGLLEVLVYGILLLLFISMAKRYFEIVCLSWSFEDNIYQDFIHRDILLFIPLFSAQIMVVIQDAIVTGFTKLIGDSLQSIILSLPFFFCGCLSLAVSILHYKHRIYGWKWLVSTCALFVAACCVFPNKLEFINMCVLTTVRYTLLQTVFWKFTHLVRVARDHLSWRGWGSHVLNSTLLSGLLILREVPMRNTNGLTVDIESISRLFAIIPSGFLFGTIVSVCNPFSRAVLPYRKSGVVLGLCFVLFVFGSIFTWQLYIAGISHQGHSHPEIATYLACRQRISGRLNIVDLAKVTQKSYSATPKDIEKYLHDSRKEFFQNQKSGNASEESAKRRWMCEYMKEEHVQPETVTVCKIVTEDGNTTTQLLVIVRGTAGLQDVLMDLDTWFTIAYQQFVGYAIVPPIFFISPTLRSDFIFYARNIIGAFVPHIYHTVHALSDVYFKHCNNTKCKGAVFVGHSLGGGLSLMAVDRILKNGTTAAKKLQAVGFSSPGITFSADLLGKDPNTDLRDLDANILNIVPRGDPVPTVDEQAGMVQYITCHQSWIQCHKIDFTLAELETVCTANNKNKPISAWTS